MRFATLTALVGLGALSLVGCGGGGGNGGGGGGGSKADAYAGTYIGTYETSKGAIGRFSFTVASTGALTNGTIVVSGSTVALTGSISSSGAATLQPAGQSASSGQVSGSGQMTLTGALKDTAGDTLYVDALFNPSGPAAGSTYSNDYTGTNKNVGTGLISILSLHVDGSGNVSGTDLIDVSNVVEFANLNGTISPSGELNYTLTVNGSLVTTTHGQLTLANSNLTGTLTNTLGDILDLHVQIVN